MSDDITNTAGQEDVLTQSMPEQGEILNAEYGPAVMAEPQVLVPADTVLGGRYVVNGAFPRRSRLSETYLCTWRQRPYVAKVYEEGSGFDKTAANLLTQVNSPYVVRVLKAGRFEGHPYQVSPYFRNGSLEGWTFDADTIAAQIVPQLNRGLNALHAKGIVHGDLTPSNILRGDEPGEFLIADYGSQLAGDPNVEDLAQVIAAGDLPITYQAPETREGPPTPESDYYSLGIVLFVLFTGQMPVEQPRTLDAFAPRFDYPADMPARLRNLIIGLTHLDLSNQANPANPNRRWTYNEVRRWCAGDTLVVPIESFGPGAAILPYAFEGKQYTSLGALAAAMAVNWVPGKQHLFSGALSRFFAVTDPDTAKICERAEAAQKRNPKRENAIYLETLLRLSPDLTSLYWQDEYIGTPEEAGEALEKGEVAPAIADMIAQGALAGYLRAKYPEDSSRSRTMAWAERAYTAAANDPEKREVARNVMVRILTGDFQYTADDQIFDDLPEFTAFCLELREKDKDAWSKLADELVLGPGKLAPSFEAWLLSLGKADAIASWGGGRARTSSVVPGSALPPDKDAHDEWIL